MYSFPFFLDLLFISSKYLVKNNVIQTTLLQIIFSRPIFNCTACTVPPAQSSAAGGINKGLSESEIVHGPGFGIPLVPSVAGLAPPSGQAFLVTQVFLINVNFKRHYPEERVLEGLKTKCYIDPGFYCCD